MLRRSARRALTPWRRQSIRIADRVRFPPQSRHNALPSGQPAAPLLWRQAMADDRFPSRFAANASLLPHIADLANDRVLIALLGEADYRAASFLDQRLLTDRDGRDWRAWNALHELGAAVPRPARKSTRLNS